MFHLAAYTAALGAGAFSGNFTPLADDALNFGGTQYFMPENLPLLVGGATVDSGGRIDQANIQAPTTDNLGGYEIPIGSGVVPVDMNKISNPQHKGFIPIPSNEGVNFNVSAIAGVASQAWSFVWFSDNNMDAVEGEIFSIRATTTIAGSNTEWRQQQITPINTLPAGRFQVVGFQTVATDVIASRLNFVNSSVYPGVLGQPSFQQITNDFWRRGRAGVWGEFTNRSLPSVWVLGGLAGAQTHYLDLIFLGQ